MSVKLSQEHEAYVQHLIAMHGFFNTPEEVIETALNLLNNTICPTHSARQYYKSLILEGIAAIERGEVVDGETAFKEIREKWERYRHEDQGKNNDLGGV